MSPILPFLNISGTSLSLSTSDVSHVSSQTVILTIGLTSFTNIQKISVSFTVTVTCEVFNFVFSTTPSVLTTV